MQVGFNQMVRLNWLEQTAELALAGYNASEIQSTLDNLLQTQISVGSSAERSSRSKTISILLKTWVKSPDQLKGFHDAGLQLFKELPTNEHIALHWGMVLAAYPFFELVACIINKLIKLQGNFSSNQLRQRIYEELGERSTLHRAYRRVLGSMVEWGILLELKSGYYTTASPLAVTNTQLISWLVEASLLASHTTSGLFQTLTKAPTLFPFEFPSVSPAQLETNPRLEFSQQGLDQSVITIRNLAPSLR
jgi:hypothetical protein